MTRAAIKIAPLPAPELSKGVRRELAAGWPIVLAIALPTLISIGLCCYQLSTANVLFGVYDGDDGVYFGAAVRLSEGLFPYRDFIIVHPPGIAVLLLPLAALSHVVGTRTGLGLARCLTALVTAANVILVGLLVRHRGSFSTLAACLFLACFPVAVAADNTLLLEPYLACCCLIGARLAFDGDELATPRRIAFAGVAFGVAGSVKLWAFFPVVLISGYLLFGHRRELARFVSGVAAGFFVVCAPFIVSAPVGFFRDVVVSQWLRGRRGALTVSLGGRFLELTGLAGLDPNLAPKAGVAAAAALGTVMALYFVLLAPRPPLEGLLLGAAIAAVGAEFISREFYAYYAYFPAVFIAPLCALVLGEVVARARRRLSSFPRRVPRIASRWMLRISLAVAILATALIVPNNARYAARYLHDSGVNNPAPVIDAMIPPGACVLSVDVVYALVANRFDSSTPNCPALDDSYGTWIALNDGRPPVTLPYSPALVARWRSWLGEAAYLIYRQGNVKIPWTPALLHWFNDHYRLLSTENYYQIFVNIDAPPLPIGSS